MLFMNYKAAANGNPAGKGATERGKSPFRLTLADCLPSSPETGLVCSRMPIDSMIACENLTKRFGHFTAVDHVSFSVSKGSIFGFLGPNGSGKSTVIRMLCGILEPSGGRASIAGLDAVVDAEQLKGMLGYMSQNFSLYDEL